jgi:hypothetical protein
MVSEKLMMNWKRCGWKAAVVARLKVIPLHFLEGLRKPRGNPVIYPVFRMRFEPGISRIRRSRPRPAVVYCQQCNISTLKIYLDHLMTLFQLHREVRCSLML